MPVPKIPRPVYSHVLRCLTSGACSGLILQFTNRASILTLTDQFADGLPEINMYSMVIRHFGQHPEQSTKGQMVK